MELTELQRAAAASPPSADELAGTFASRGPVPGRSAAERAAVLADLGFGTEFTDHVARATWTVADGWGQRRLEGYGPHRLDPAASVLHYGQEVFEGLKAYRHADGSIWTFRPTWNAARLQASARRLALPELPVADFLASLVDLVRADAAWVPSAAGAALYLRPFMYAAEPFLGVRAAHTVAYEVIASPCGPYFRGGFTPVSIWVTRDYHRAGPGGTGAAKTAGNYAASLLPQQQAAARGFDQVCYLDVTNTYLEELGGMNIFVVGADGVVYTPALTGTILEGCTRDSIITLLRDQGHQVCQEHLSLAWLRQGLASGAITEMFACGTAAVVTAIGRLAGDDFDAVVGDGKPGPVTEATFTALTALQLGQAPDPHGWMYRLA